MGHSSRRSGGINLLNILAVLVFSLAVFFVLGVLVVAARPQLLPGPLAGLVGAAEATPVVSLPTPIAAAVVPTATNTPDATAVPNLVPTFTPAVVGTQPPEATNTRRPTLTPSITPLLPSRTPIPTDTPTPTNTPDATDTPIPSPTNTRSPFQFTKSLNSPRFEEQRFYNVNCNWMGFAGQVFDVDNRPITGSYRVHVWEDRPGGLNLRAVVGDAPIYGGAGWEQFVSESPLVWTYFLQLERGDGSPVSQVYQVTTRASCRENLILFDFLQNYR